MAQLSDDTQTPQGDTAPAALPGDGLREGIVDTLRNDIGDALIDTLLKPNDDLWVRVSAESWLATGQALKAAGFTYFCFLSAIDWMPSPFGNSQDDPDDEPKKIDMTIKQGYTGGETRMQVFARLTDIDRHVGLTIKADVADDNQVVDSWSSSLPVPTGMNANATRCSVLVSTTILTSATCTCPAISRATRSRKIFRCSPAWLSHGRASSTSSQCPTSKKQPTLQQPTLQQQKRLRAPSKEPSHDPH